MLSLMNVTVIPFLLGALMSVEDVKEWNFGPVYVFKLKKLTRVYMDLELGIYVNEEITAMLRCRPKLSLQSIQDVLFCHTKNIIGRTNITRQIYDNWKDISNFIFERSIGINDGKSINFHEESIRIPDRKFKIKFDRQGVLNFKVKGRKKKIHHYDIMTDIIDQFNIGTDLSIVAVDSMRTYTFKRPYVISTFTLNEENTTRASKCNTSGSIMSPLNILNQYNKYANNLVKKNKTKFGFQLKLLPISYTNPTGKLFLIERNRMACTHQPQYLMLSNEKWKIHNMKRYSNIMNIRNKNRRFTSYTRLEGDVYFPTTTRTIYNFRGDVYLHLVRIKPARKELNPAKYK
ncbi:uncharacterized protein [Linepithema humile]|uniref:uncharacterized protein isoform X1 n=1 Tax=Linepithema humile TaxID=83485 RepID=UPI00351EA542